MALQRKAQAKKTVAKDKDKPSPSGKQGLSMSKRTARRGKSDRTGELLHENTKPGVFLPVPQFCEEMKIDRATLAKKLNREENLSTEQSKIGVLYRLRDLVNLGILHNAQGVFQPELLDPFRRKAHYQAELDRLKIGVSSGELIPRSEAEQKWAGAMKLVAHFFDTLPDIMERDTGAKGAQLQKMEEVLDRLRIELYEKLIKSDDDEQEDDGQATADRGIKSDNVAAG